MDMGVSGELCKRHIIGVLADCVDEAGGICAAVCLPHPLITATPILQTVLHKIAMHVSVHVTS